MSAATIILAAIACGLWAVIIWSFGYNEGKKHANEQHRLIELRNQFLKAQETQGKTSGYELH